MEEDENKKEDPKEKVVLNFESDSDKTIQCQKQVLVEKSDYFKAMFSSGMVESQNNTVEMKDIDIDLMRCLVEFMMSGEINLTENNIYEITEAATRFQVADLISLCSAFLKKILSFENCFKMLEYSKQFNLKKLHNKCKAFIQHNFCKTPRFPCCTARCYLEDDSAKDINQTSYLKFIPDQISTLNNLDYKVINWNAPLTEDPKEYEVDEKFTDKINAILEPLQFLQYGENGYEIAENCDIPYKDQWLIIGFEANFLNTRGRIAVKKLLEKLFSTSNTISLNIGGSSTCYEPSARKHICSACNEPSARQFIFIVELPDALSSSSSDSSPEEKLVKEKPRVSTQLRVLVQVPSPKHQTILKTNLIPDVVLESINKEYLVVEVKKEARTTIGSSLDQSKFQLIPASLVYGSAYALLITDIEAYVLECFKTEDPPSLTFKQTKHKFKPEDLAKDVKGLLEHLCSILSNVE